MAKRDFIKADFFTHNGSRCDSKAAENQLFFSYKLGIKVPASLCKPPDVALFMLKT
ncbi:hypothetical protein [Pontibacter sp. SGAir0037]|uniref:hypothetical protein n=1 Tax=Pontibacter sp. SGAir0037 TaxID=2571030 RepID=UPI00143DF17B|nr:hypothetical protein [Pontibacter sp. SGAir0037]